MKFKWSYLIYVIVIIIVGVSTSYAAGFMGVRIIDGQLNVTTNIVNTSIYQYNGTATENLNMNGYSILNAVWMNGTKINTSKICLNNDCQTGWPSGGSGGGANVSTTTCGANNHVSAINNATGIVTCSVDTAGTESDPLWSANYTAFNNSWSRRDNSSYEYWTNSTLNTILNNVNASWNETRANALYYLLTNPSSYISSETLFIGNWSYLNSKPNNTANSSYYLASNPSSYISSETLFIGNWSYLNSKPNNTANSSYYLASNPSGYISSESLFIGNWSYLNSKPNNTANSSYYLASNPSGYISSGTNASTTTCSGTDKFSAFNNQTGVFTCSADQTGGTGGTNYWQTSGSWMFPNITAGGLSWINLTNVNATGDINGSRLFDSGLRVLTSYTETDPRWNANYTAFNASWSLDTNTYPNVSTTTCTGTQKVSAVNNATGIVTCSADVDTANTTSEIINAISSTGLGTGNITSGTLSNGRLDTQLYWMNSTGLSASNITSGTINLARLSGITTSQLTGNLNLLGPNITANSITATQLATNLGLGWSNLTGFPTITTNGGLAGGGDLSTSRTFTLSPTLTLNWGNISGTLGGGNITSGTVTTTQLATNLNLKGPNITTNSITTTQLATNLGLNGPNITSGTITATQLTGSLGLLLGNITDPTDCTNQAVIGKTGSTWDCASVSSSYLSSTFTINPANITGQSSSWFNNTNFNATNMYTTNLILNSNKNITTNSTCTFIWGPTSKLEVC